MLSSLSFGAPSSGIDLSWKKLWFPFTESLTTPKYCIWGQTASKVGTFASGEVIQDASGNTGRLIKAMAEVPQEYYSPGGMNAYALIYNPISGIMAAPSTVTGQGSGATISFDFGPFPALADDTWQTFITKSALAGSDLILTDDGYAGCTVGDRSFLGTNRYSTIGNKDFIFQVVTDAIIAAGDFVARIGGDLGAYDILRMNTSSAQIGNVISPDSISGGGNATPGQFSQAIVRCGNTFQVYLDTTPRQASWQPISAGNQTLNNFNAGAEFHFGVSTDAADSRFYGILLGIFANGLPSTDAVLAGLAYHKTQWLANNKVLYTGW